MEPSEKGTHKTNDHQMSNTQLYEEKYKVLCESKPT